MQSLSSILIPVAVVLVAGLGFALQSPINATLGRSIGSGVAAAMISFGTGFAALVVLTLLIGDGAAAGRALSVSPVLWLGGFLGAYIVWAMLWAVPSVGILTAFAALLLGQLTGALVLDALGLFGLPVHAITPTRLLAVAMVAGGLLLSRL